MAKTLPFQIKALLFDLDNTLFDRDTAFSSWADEFIAAHFPDPTDHEGAKAILIERDEGGYGSKATMFAALKDRYPALSKGIDTMVEEYYPGVLKYGVLEDGTVQLLDALARNNIPFGIVTNGAAFQMDKIRNLNLHERTSCIFVSALYGTRKPEAAIFKAALNNLGTSASETLFVGDNPEADICGAHKVGMHTAWLHRGKSWPDHLPARCVDLRIGALTDLIPLLEVGQQSS